MTDKFNLSQLTQEMIVSRLKQAGNVPMLAAEIAKKTIVAAVLTTHASHQSPAETIEEICLGVMNGILLLEKDLPATAVNILRCMSEAAQETHLDPSDMMTWAMRGIARATPLITMDARWNIQQAIDQQYLGAGEVFKRLCDDLGQK